MEDSVTKFRIALMPIEWPWKRTARRRREPRLRHLRETCLLPLCADTFYRKGVWRSEKVFERDSEGRIVRLLDRRENNDLVWKRTP